MGLINRCVPADELDQVVDDFADQLANGAIRAIQWTKQAINAPLKQIVSANLDYSLSLESKSNITEDHQKASTLCAKNVSRSSKESKGSR